MVRNTISGGVIAACVVLCAWLAGTVSGENAGTTRGHYHIHAHSHGGSTHTHGHSHHSGGHDSHDVCDGWSSREPNEHDRDHHCCGHCDDQDSESPCLMTTPRSVQSGTPVALRPANWVVARSWPHQPVAWPLPRGRPPDHLASIRTVVLRT